MRYLYGDSTPFPLGYNFLATLEAFMAASTRIVQLDLERSSLAKQRDEVAQSRLRGLEELEQFHDAVMRAVQDTAQKVHHQNARDYARAIADHATKYVEEHRRSVLSSNERETSQLRADGERRTAEMRAAIESFLKAARVPVVRTKLALRLNVEGKDLRYVGTAAFEHPDNIATTFTIAPHRLTSWTGPRKISDFAHGVDLWVGVEKSWLRGTVTAKQLTIDDWTIVELGVSDALFELGLRRKATDKETLFFRARRNEAGVVSASVEHPGAVAEALPGDLSGQDLAQIERLWLALRTATRDLLEQREQLLGVSLDAQPVLDSGLAVPFIVRLVSMFAPTVREISKRSPNEFELTLKFEADGGRREELYLRKEALVGNVQPLPAKGRELFAPLGLDAWVPSMTTAPPAVTASSPPPRSDGVQGPPPVPSAIHTETTGRRLKE